jgi:hypothetical protein
MLRLLFSEQRILLLAPASFAAGAGQGFLLGAWMSGAVAGTCGAQYVGFVGATYSLSSALSARQWGPLAQRPAFGRRWAMASACTVHALWYACMGLGWWLSGAEAAPASAGSAASAASAAPQLSSAEAAGRLLPLLLAIAVYSAFDPVVNALLQATLQSFFPSQPQLSCASASPRFFYCLGFAGQQLLSLSLAAAAGRPCLAEQCALLCALVLLSAMSMRYLHTRVASLDNLPFKK